MATKTFPGLHAPRIVFDAADPGLPVISALREDLGAVEELFGTSLE